MRVRHLVITSAMALAVGAGIAEPAFAAVPSPGPGPTQATAAGRSAVVIGSLSAVSRGGTATLLIDVGRRHPQEKPLTIVTTAATVIVRGGRPVRLAALNGAKVTVTGKRSGDRVTAVRVAA